MVFPTAREDRLATPRAIYPRTNPENHNLMARPSSLSAAEQAETRAFALRARADSTHRGYGSTQGALGRNATEVVRDWIAERHGVEMSVRGVQALLGRLGLVHRRAGQGGCWIERPDQPVRGGAR
jgi:hypothetical protein